MASSSWLACSRTFRPRSKVRIGVQTPRICAAEIGSAVSNGGSRNDPRLSMSSRSDVKEGTAVAEYFLSAPIEDKYYKPTLPPNVNVASWMLDVIGAGTSAKGLIAPYDEASVQVGLVAPAGRGRRSSARRIHKGSSGEGERRTRRSDTCLPRLSASPPGARPPAPVACPCCVRRSSFAVVRW